MSKSGLIWSVATYKPKRKIIGKRQICRDNMKIKRTQFWLRFVQLYWLLRSSSCLILRNKLHIYKAILKPIWSYGDKIWGNSTEPNFKVIQAFQNKVFWNIAGAPFYVRSDMLHSDLSVPTGKETIK